MKNKKMIFYIAMVVLIILSILLYLFPLGDKVDVDMVITNNDFGSLPNNSVITSPIKLNNSSIEALTFTIVTYCNKYDRGTIIAKLYDNDNNIIATKDIHLKDINDNEQIVLRFAKVNNTQGKIFKLELTTKDFAKDTKVSFWSVKQTDESLFTTVNDEKIEKNIAYNTKGVIPNKFYSWYPILLCVLTFICYVLYGRGE